MRRVGVGTPFDPREAIDVAIQAAGVEARRFFGFCVFGEALQDGPGLFELEDQVVVAYDGNDEGLIKGRAELVLTGR